MKRVVAYIWPVFWCFAVSAYPVGTHLSSTSVIAPLSNIGDVANEKIRQIIQPKTISFSPPFPDSGRKQAVLEQESLVSKVDSTYSFLQQMVANLLSPRPIVDTIQEHEKYGNDGEKFRSIGTAVVGGIEGASNLLNAAVEVPFEVAKQIGKKITTSLNGVGGKLVGLAK